MTKAPFVLDHTTKNSPLEGVASPAGAQAAVRQPSTPASGRGDALEGGDSCAIPPPFQRREVGVRTSHTTAAERLSSIPINALLISAQGPTVRSSAPGLPTTPCLRSCVTRPYGPMTAGRSALSWNGVYREESAWTEPAHGRSHAVAAGS